MQREENQVDMAEPWTPTVIALLLAESLGSFEALIARLLADA